MKKYAIKYSTDLKSTNFAILTILAKNKDDAMLTIKSKFPDMVLYVWDIIEKNK